MKVTAAIVLLGLCILSVPNRSKAARILIVYAIPSYSHQVPFRPLWIELSKRGHELVIISSKAILDANSTNIRQIDLGTHAYYKGLSSVQHRLNRVPYLEYLKTHTPELLPRFAHHAFNNSEVKQLYAPDSGEKFDLIMIELLQSYAWFALAHRFNAPVIGLNTVGLFAVDNFVLGDMVFPSHDSTWELETNVGGSLPFWSRLKNFCQLWHYIYFVYRDIVTASQKIAEHYFGTPLPSIMDIVANISLVFVNVDYMMTYARPELPNIIRFHSVHSGGEPEPLPQDLQSFIDDAPNGFIYFCIGSSLEFLELPDEIRQIFYDVFAELPYKIVWKINKLPPLKLKNVYASSWLPQQSVLAHPNVKLYMFHGGAMSTQEAIHYTVPVLGFPVIADQEMIMKKLKSFGVGNRLCLETLTREVLNATIRETISNKVYKRNMIELRALLRDTQHDWVKDLTWWTEYVIRNRGAPHLRTSLASQKWFTYSDMDIVVFLTVIAFVICIITLAACVKLYMYASKRYQQISLCRKKKIS